MKYVKCPRCGLNYITAEQTMCKVCENEIMHVPSAFDEEERLLCPLCLKNTLRYDEVICSECRNKRLQNESE